MTTTDTTPATETRCLGPNCGRKLTSPESIARGMGPRCWAKVAAAAKTADLAPWTASQVEDAKQAIEDGAVVPSTREGVFQIVSRDGERVRRTMAGGCNCEAGLKTSQPRPCWHRCAVAIMLAAQAPAAEIVRIVPAPVALPSSDRIWAELGALGALDGVLAAF
jgi:hypothetical protein